MTAEPAEQPGEKGQGLSTFRRVAVTYRPSRQEMPIEDRWWGSTVRGALGKALFRSSCTRNDPNCQKCDGREDCPYAQAWAPRKEDPTEAGPTFRPPPYRLVVHPISDQRITVHLWLFGREAGRLPLWRASLDLAMTLLKVPGAPFLPCSSVQVEEGALETAQESLEGGKMLSVHLKTPLRLVVGGEVRRRPPTFLELLEAAHRRHCLGAAAWGWPSPPALSPEERRLAEAVLAMPHHLRWQELGRYSARQGRAMRLGGLAGTLRFEGPWSLLWPRLQPSAVLGLGHLTTMGFGHVSFASKAE